MRYRFNKFQYDGYSSELLFYRKEMPLRSSKRDIHAIPRGRHFKAEGLPLWAGDLLIELSVWEKECSQKPDNSTSYNITLLSLKMGQEKTGYRHSRKDWCSQRTFIEEKEWKCLEGKFKFWGRDSLPNKLKYVSPPCSYTSSLNTHKQIIFLHMCVSFRSGKQLKTSIIYV